MKTRRTIAFVEQIGEYQFSFERLILNSNNDIFFVTNNMPGERSFFMSKYNDAWQILFISALGKDVLRLERELADVIVQHGF